MNFRTKVKGLSLLFALATITVCSAQDAPENPTIDDAPVVPAERVSAGSASKQKARGDFPRKPEEVLKDLVEAKGFNGLHVDKKKLKGVLEIPASQLKRPFLLATSVSGGSTFAGWQWNHHLLYWKRHDKKLMLIEKNVQYRAKSSNPLADAVNRTYSDQLVLTLPIESRTSRGGYLISMNSLFARSASKFFGYAVGSLDASLAVFSKAKSFPTNNEIAVTMPERGGGSFVTLHYSLRSLPRTSYEPREADDRVGYFLTVAKDFDKGAHNDNRFVRFINRWNLQKLDSSLELSPVKEPIVFYLEKTIPVAYRRFVAEGILEWNKAFEKVGFLDAVQVRQQTETNEFKDFDPEDARYNFIRWITSQRAFAMGPSRTNPMTGEILDADIIFDDSMLDWALTDYDRFFKVLGGSKTLIQAQLESLPMSQRFAAETMLASGHMNEGELSKFDKNLRQSLLENGHKQNRHVCQFGRHKRHEMALASLNFKKAGTKLPLEFIGEFVKETVMHEVGHTLGLRHNFIGSTWLPLEAINGKDKPKATSASVMDYNPLNVSPDEKKQGHLQTGALGPYDFWAIEYGYGKDGDRKALQKLAAKSVENGLAYATDEDTYGPDPYVNRWDMGLEPLNFSKSRVQIAEKMVKDLEKRSLTDGRSYRWLRWAFANVLYEYDNAASYAVRYIGGVHMRRDHYSKDAKRDPIEPVAGDKQRAALEFILKTIAGSGSLEFRTDLLRKLGPNRWGHWQTRAQTGAFPIVRRVKNIQVGAVKAIFTTARMRRIIENEIRSNPTDKPLTLTELFQSSTASVTSELDLKSDKQFTVKSPFISVYRRNLQRAYVDHLIKMALDTDESFPTAAKNLAWTTLSGVNTRIAACLKGQSEKMDQYSRAHLEEMSKRIDKARDANYQLGGKDSSGGGFNFLSLFGKKKKAKSE